MINLTCSRSKTHLPGKIFALGQNTLVAFQAVLEDLLMLLSLSLVRMKPKFPANNLNQLFQVLKPGRTWLVHAPRQSQYQMAQNRSAQRWQPVQTVHTLLGSSHWEAEYSRGRRIS
jgi:hypothetical protein